jgi:hypothetical protein
MAVLRIEDGELALHLSAAEKVGAVHGDLRIPLSAVRRVEVLEDAHEPADHGMKLGTRIPGRTEVGTVRGDGRNIFAVVLPDTPRGVRIVLDGSFYHEWIIGCADPESVAQQITAKTAPGGRTAAESTASALPIALIAERSADTEPASLALRDTPSARRSRVMISSGGHTPATIRSTSCRAPSTRPTSPVSTMLPCARMTARPA